MLAVAIILAILGAGEFALCLWGSILVCATGGCCERKPVAYTVSCYWHLIIIIMIIITVNLYRAFCAPFHTCSVC